jgi:hypothetical protein
MLRLPLALVSALLGMMVVVGLAYALPEGSPAISGGVRKTMPTTSMKLMALVRNPKVEKELNLSDEQKEKMTELQQETGRELSQATQGLDREAVIKKLREMFPKVKEKEDKRLMKVLNPEQLQRLRQILLQMQGVDVFREPEVIHALGLSLEQQEKLNSMLKQADKQRAGMSDQVGLHIGEFGGAPAQSTQEAMKKALKALTPEQRQKFDKIVGRPFEF